MPRHTINDWEFFDRPHSVEGSVGMRGLTEIRLLSILSTSFLNHSSLFSLTFFISFFIVTFLYIIIASVEGYCCTWPHTMTLRQQATLLWARDQLIAETSTWQHTTLTRDRHLCPQRDSNPRSQKSSGLIHTIQKVRWPRSAILPFHTIKSDLLIGLLSLLFI